MNLNQKEEAIKSLTLKLNKQEQQIINLNDELKVNDKQYNTEINKRAEDLDFYKKSYEEQKGRVNKEHELISSSLCELALQFLTLKNDLSKKVQSTNSNNSNDKNWLESERNKNFPLDK